MLNALYSAIPILVISIIVFSIGFTSSKQNAQYVKLLLNAYRNSNYRLIKDLKARTFTSGVKTQDFHFTNCDILILKDGIVLIGFYKFFKKLYKVPLFLITKPRPPAAYCYKHLLKNYNSNSFDSSFYLEFGESSVTSTNVEIRVFGLSVDQKIEIENALKH